jgi:ABC-type multidrug transport system fused ATPase/permease subunit
VSNLVIIFTKAFASAKRVNEILDASSSISYNLNSIADGKSNNPIIEFKNVSFGYSSTGDTALENISLSIKRGETIGIIGSTGSGKSSFVNLIARFYDANHGEIFIDGTDIKSYPLIKLRNKISIVPQKALLFSETISENIRWGKKDATMEEIKKACVISQAHEFINELPEGYETVIGERGVKLSGGQKQRLSIARAVLRNTPILILDEATASVDVETEARIQQAIQELAGSRTIIVIAHRLSTVKRADKILVIKEGQIVESGSHDSLIQENGLYKQLCDVQFQTQE